LKAGRRSAPQRCDVAGPGSGGAASQKRRPAGRGKRYKGKGENGGEDKKVKTTEGIEEQRALYSQAKRYEDALPDRAGLNPKRQRTGNQTT
jgi:hypothetical protein